MMKVRSQRLGAGQKNQRRHPCQKAEQQTELPYRGARGGRLSRVPTKWLGHDPLLGFLGYRGQRAGRQSRRSIQMQCWRGPRFALMAIRPRLLPSQKQRLGSSRVFSRRVTLSSISADPSLFGQRIISKRPGNFVPIAIRLSDARAQADAAFLMQAAPIAQETPAAVDRRRFPPHHFLPGASGFRNSKVNRRLCIRCAGPVTIGRQRVRIGRLGILSTASPRGLADDDRASVKRCAIDVYRQRSPAAD